MSDTTCTGIQLTCPCLVCEGARRMEQIIDATAERMEAAVERFASTIREGLNADRD